MMMNIISKDVNNLSTEHISAVQVGQSEVLLNNEARFTENYYLSRTDNKFKVFATEFTS